MQKASPISPPRIGCALRALESNWCRDFILNLKGEALQMLSVDSIRIKESTYLQKKREKEGRGEKTTLPLSLGAHFWFSFVSLSFCFSFVSPSLSSLISVPSELVQRIRFTLPSLPFSFMFLFFESLLHTDTQERERENEGREVE